MLYRLSYFRSFSFFGQKGLARSLRSHRPSIDFRNSIGLARKKTLAHPSLHKDWLAKKRSPIHRPRGATLTKIFNESNLLRKSVGLQNDPAHFELARWAVLFCKPMPFGHSIIENLCGRRWIRTTEDVRQQIYSLPHLATLVFSQFLTMNLRPLANGYPII